MNQEEPDKGEKRYRDHINSGSMEVMERAWIEHALTAERREKGFQIGREGYFVADR